MLYRAYARPLRFNAGKQIHTSQSSYTQKLMPQRGSKLPVVKGKAKEEVVVDEPYIKRNELGVQLLPRRIHHQVFRNATFPAPNGAYIQIAREHLHAHGLDPSQGSVLPDISFTLPPLQGKNLDEHFHRLGAAAAQPWLNLARDFASTSLLPKPDCWNLQSGWTKYVYQEDGSSYHIPIEYPDDTALSFDIETLPHYHPYPIIACAVSKDAWYAWVSPWLLGESEDPEHLIPFGNPDTHRVVVGHNVSYDRGRIADEYCLKGTKSRFIDTMALHIAVKGISSHQRPAWKEHRKTKEKEEERRVEAMEAVENCEILEGVDETKKEELRKLRSDMEESLPLLQADEADIDEASSKRWEDLTSANSLADVARLHCDIDMDKGIRDDFLSLSREDILDNVQDYLNYCGNDVYVTHAVFSRVLPAFLKACPSPVSFAGILTMGSSFLTVNESWEKYIENAEKAYKELEENVKGRLVQLALEAKELMLDNKWKGDVWLEQLDWTPKIAKGSRGVACEQDPELDEGDESEVQHPKWFKTLLSNPFRPSTFRNIVPSLLNLAFDGAPVTYSSEHGWHTVVDGQINPLPLSGSSKSKVTNLLTPKNGLPHLKSGRLTSNEPALAELIARGDRSETTEKSLIQLAGAVLSDCSSHQSNPWLYQLDWSVPRPKKAKKAKLPPVIWPKWYWDLTAPKKNLPPGTIDITIRTRFSPLLLKLSWQGWPLFHSKEHGWIFRVPASEEFTCRTKALTFKKEEDAELAAMNNEQLPASETRGESAMPSFYFYKLPHKDGEKANVGNPLAKTFITYSQDGTMTSPEGAAKDALDLNAQCSYWISARDRVLKQMVVWQKGSRDLGFRQGSERRKWGVILPQVITMGTVTRRAIEKTWLTASNAKKNRVGSELKAMVQAPDGYAIVGADVDSEELWISSVMGDAQFGVHGATAIGWMTLEGTKGAGTDLHSKTAAILEISRDQAKVFNYSRIYGAGGKHAVLLLLQSNPSMIPAQAKKLADQLYASTKGKNTHHDKFFDRKFWYGGTESFVFNKLEEIATSDHPRTPALGCGITYALSKGYLPSEYGKDYMPSRINWAVQSSGVDYLHLLIVSMEYLIAKYNINARYLISVHDELRYLVTEEDKYRVALALQIANLWTRCLFALKLGMGDLPQGVAWFSAVDVDKVLRKEVDMPCITPSHPDPIPPGESLDITQILEKTNNGSLWRDGRAMTSVFGGQDDPVGNLDGYVEPNCLAHRADSAAWLRAQAADDLKEIKFLHKAVSGEPVGQRGGTSGKSARGKSSGADAPNHKPRWVNSVGAPSEVEQLVEAEMIE
ncbi:hypothetical protein BDM02DRAFT_3108903 [Thelephora ganbajun]|uniref:Uncharacterized protein n=1 Tax=Thelephora ganbajun TaxID=370292 RepID=A0ACB6ZTY3_THEGA|nr:hypothetical protein BDM02DRAFT_3108903 [Thelephora ganbajun]